MRLQVLLLALSALLTAPAAAQGPSPAGSKSFGGWTGTCNNLGACVAIGTTEDDKFFYVRIARDAGASTAPQVKLVLVAQDKLPGDSPSFTLTAHGQNKAVTLGPYPATTDPSEKTQFDAILAPVDVSVAFIEAIRNADTLDYALLGTKSTLDLKGLSATLRWVDAQQGRAGTPTALVARGMTPIGQVPDAPEPPSVVAAPAGSVGQIAKPTISQSVLDAARSLSECEEDTVKAHQDVEAWRLGPDMILYVVPCTNGAYNFGSALYFTDGKGETPRPVDLPQPPGSTGGSARNVLFNEAFDPNTMTLSDFAKGRGIGDCGETTSWVWTGQAFALLSASALDACPGAMVDDWPSLYMAQRR